MLNSFDYGIIIVYFISMMVVGIISVKFAKTREDYLVAGRRLSFPMFFGCMAALVVGGGTTLGTTKLGYKYGISGIWLAGSLGVGLIIMGFLLSSKVSKMKVLSINEVIGDNYGPYSRMFSSVLTFIYTTMLGVVQVIAIGAILSVIMGWNAKQSMLIGGGIVIFYTFVGGMWSVSMTDIIQFVIKTLGVLLLAPIFAVGNVGGWANVVSHVPKAYFSITNIGMDGIVMYVLMYVPGIIIGQDIWQRVFTAKNDKVAKKGTILAGVYSILYGLAAVILGMCVFVTNPALSNPQDAFVKGILSFLPMGIKGFVLAAAMAATMSVASGAVMASSTILFNDFYLPFFKTKSNVKRDIWVNRGFALLIGVVVMIFAFLIQDVLVALDMAYAYLSGCVFVPVLATFVLKRFSPRAGLASLAVSSVLVTGMFFKYGISSNYPIIYGILSGLIVYTVVNIIDKKKVISAVE